MSAEAVVVGVGELGGLFAHGFLRSGLTVVPVRRRDPLATVAQTHPSPDLVLVAVGEDDLDAVLASCPVTWRKRVCLIQNELLPHAWQAHDLTTPTVCVVWFEKKRGKAVKELLPSVVHGPAAARLAQALTEVGIGSRVAESSDDLLTALIEKNAYILTTNLAGMRTGGTVEELFDAHREFALSVLAEVIELQSALTSTTVNADAILTTVERAVQADPAHQCTGRSAPRRLERALAHGDRLGLSLPVLRGLT